MYDVIVVGAGPAGAATGILLADRGLEVLVLDRSRFPRPRICGEYLSPEAARVLDRMGALKAVEAAGAVPLSGMRITAPDGTVLTADYRPVAGWRPYCGHALAVSRTALDAILTDRLRALPVDFRERVRVTGVRVEGDRVVGVTALDADGAPLEFAGRAVVGADGRASVVAHQLGCRAPHRLQRAALVTYVRGVPDCTERGEIFVDPPDYAILNPLDGGRVNLSLVVPLGDFAPWRGRLETFFRARLVQVRHLVGRVGGSEQIAPVQAMAPLAWRVRPPREGGVLLVGDAAGFYDPFTGEGVFKALRGAELAAETLAPALRAGDLSAAALAAYWRARRAAFADRERFTRLLNAIVRRRWAANAAARFLSRRPALLDAVLGVVGDYVPARALLRPSLLAG